MHQFRRRCINKNIDIDLGVKVTQNVAQYNAINVYCRELAPGAVSLTGDRAQGDDNKHCRDYTLHIIWAMHLQSFKLLCPMI